MEKQQIIEFVKQYSLIVNGQVNNVVNDVKDRIIDRIECWSLDEFSSKDIEDIEYDLLIDEWIIYYDEIVKYYSKNRADIEDLIDAAEVWDSMIHNRRASIIDAIQYAVYAAHNRIISMILGDVQVLYA